eukprot:scaffold6136_cov56-Phaeocystis_antarctica.AAC.2
MLRRTRASSSLAVSSGADEVTDSWPISRGSRSTVDHDRRTGGGGGSSSSSGGGGRSSTRETEVGKTTVQTSVPLGTSPLLLLRCEPTGLPAFTTGTAAWCTCFVSLVRAAQHMGSIIKKAPTEGAESATMERCVSDESVLITR